MHPTPTLAPSPARVPDAPAVEVTDLRRRYGAFEAVRGVSFEVRPGEVLALLGVNGAGKTSALEVVEGLAPASGGTVRVLGRDPRRERAAVRRHLGVVLQASGLPGDLTVAETVRTWAGTLTAPRPVGEALAEVGLGDRADVWVRSLSGGERRRLDLATALLGRPRVLVLDEPTTGLDPESRRTVWELVRRLVGDGAAVVLTTHHLEEAEELADRIAIMRAGVVVSGTREEIAATQPATVRFALDPGAPRPPVPAGVEVAGGGVAGGGVDGGGVDGGGVDGGGVDGARVEWRTAALQPVLAELLAWAGRSGVVLHGLEARAASLEQAFLAVADGADLP